MASVTIGVVGRRSGVGDEVDQSPRFSASLIGLRGHCGHGERWFPCLDLPPFLLWRCVRGDPLSYTTGVPDQDVDLIDFPIRRSLS
jgi:hypothetical protein